MTVDHRVAGDAWEALFRAQVVLMRGFTTSKVWGELSTTEYDVLFTLRRGPSEGMRQREIAQMQLIAQSSLSRLIDRLEEDGYVERGTDPVDARSALVRLTQKGQRIQREIGVRHLEDISRELGARLSTDEMRQLEHLCRKLLDDPAHT